MGSTHIGYSFYSFEVSEDSQSHQASFGMLAASEGSPIIFDDDAGSCSGDPEHPSPWPEDDEKRDDFADDQQIRGFKSGVGIREKAAAGKAAMIQPKAQEDVIVDHDAFRSDCYAGAAADEQIADEEDDAPERCHYTADELIKREMERNRLFWEACLARW